MNWILITSVLIIFSVFETNADAAQTKADNKYLNTISDNALEKVIELLKEKDNLISAMGQKLEAFEAKLKEVTDQKPSRVNNKNDIESLMKKVDMQADHIRELERTIAAMSDKMEKQFDMDSTEGLRSIIKRQVPENPVAFFATLNSTLTHLGVGQNIVFDNVLTNDGLAYNPHFGSFVAPVSGIYVFSVTLLSYNGHSNHFDYVKNGTRVSRMYVAGGGASPTWDTSSQTIVLHLDKGEDLAVHNIDADEHLYGGHFSTFAGFLLYESFDHNPGLVGY